MHRPGQNSHDFRERLPCCLASCFSLIQRSSTRSNVASSHTNIVVLCTNPHPSTMTFAVRKKRRKPNALSKRRPKPKPETNVRRTRRPPPQICKADESKVGFGDLPAELRNQIYEIALTPSDGASIRIVQIPPGIAGRTIALGLLASCKAVQKEAWSFFYERNVFRVDYLSSQADRLPSVSLFGTGQWRGHLIVNGGSFGCSADASKVHH